MELHQFAVVLLLALCAHAQPADVKHRYIHFLKQHVYGDMRPNWCDRVIGDKTREISAGNTNGCKEVNTFIVAPHRLVRPVCLDAGIPIGGGLYESTKAFTVVTCRLRSGERHPRCEYDGKSSFRKITVACDQGWPVHYEEDRLVIG